MPERRVTVVSKVGLHARPAALLARSRPMVLRIALLYALLDGSPAVDAEHL